MGLVLDAEVIATFESLRASNIENENGMSQNIDSLFCEIIVESDIQTSDSAIDSANGFIFYRETFWLLYDSRFT